MTPKVCPKCGNECNMHDRYCSRCGFDFDSAADKPDEPDVKEDKPEVPAAKPRKKGRIRRFFGNIITAIGLVPLLFAAYIAYATYNPSTSFYQHGTSCDGSCQHFCYELEGPLFPVPYEFDSASFHVDGPCRYEGASQYARRSERHDEMTESNLGEWRWEVRKSYEREGNFMTAAWGSIGLVILILGLVIRRRPK